MNPIQIILTGDAKGAVGALKDTQNELGKTYAEAGKGGSAFSALGSALGGTLVAGAAGVVAALAGLGAAMKIGLDATLQWGEQLDKLDDLFGMTGEQASGMAVAMNRVGLSVDEGAQGLNYFTRQIDEAGKAASGAGAEWVSNSEKVDELKSSLEKANTQLERTQIRMDSAKKPTIEMKWALDDAKKKVAELNAELSNTPSMVKKGEDKITPFQEALKKLGVSATDAKGKLRTFDDLLPEIMDAFSKMPAGFTASALAMDLFGERGGSKFLDFLRQGSAGMKDSLAKAKEWGLLMSTEESDAVKKFGFKMNELNLQFEGLKNKIGLAVLPIARTFIDFLDKNVMPKLREFADGLVPVIGQVQGFADAFGRALDTFKSNLAAGEDPFQALKLSLQGMMSEDLYAKVSGWLDGISKAFQEFKGWAEKEIPPALAVVKEKSQDLTTTTDLYKDFAQALGDTIPLALERFKIAFQNAGGDKTQGPSLADIVGGVMDKFNADRLSTLLAITGTLTALGQLFKGDLKSAFETMTVVLGHFNPLTGVMMKNFEAAAIYLLTLKLNTEAAKVALGQLFDFIAGDHRIQDWIDGALKLLKQVLDGINETIQAIQRGLSGLNINGITGGENARAGGGNVLGGEAYLVGERGPELFMPRGNGYVVPNHRLGGGVNVTLVYAPAVALADEYEARTKLVPFIREALRGV